MGSGVVYIRIRDGQVDRFAQGGSASYGADYTFALGPGPSLRLMDHLDYYRDRQDDDWWRRHPPEAGVLVDADRRHLLFYTVLPASDLNEHYAWRAALLDAFPRTWAGWTVTWAYDGIHELLAYPNSDQVTGRAHAVTKIYPYGRGSRADAAYLVSIADGQECRWYGLTREAEDPWWLGPGLLDVLTDADRLGTVDMTPVAGIHFDVTGRRAGVWTSVRPLNGLRRRWPALWPGWTLELWADDYGRHLACDPGAPTVPTYDLPARLQELADYVMDAWPVAEECDPRHLANLRSNAYTRSYLDANLTMAELSAATRALTGDG